MNGVAQFGFLTMYVHLCVSNFAVDVLVIFFLAIDTVGMKLSYESLFRFMRMPLPWKLIISSLNKAKTSTQSYFTNYDLRKFERFIRITYYTTLPVVPFVIYGLEMLSLRDQLKEERKEKKEMKKQMETEKTEITEMKMEMEKQMKQIQSLREEIEKLKSEKKKE